ncbi:hypothetical protein [Streptomyces sp. G-G2]|uniref:hypothetical protein n=1 Tax=Streptomyces sp. G-G2 TaxID=3046201 RepID=UPI0024BA5148|nr:hypothetical protein [Streptomyces sp. G-G2]MDJ0384779.1 hypothetical protein [Streptomyces sp. G-G2]
MYEMQVGEAVTGTGLVWHVVAHDRLATLCGRPLQPARSPVTDHHCLPCMASFQELMRGPAGSTEAGT